MFVIRDQNTGITYEAEDRLDLEEVLHSLSDGMVNTSEEEEWDAEEAEQLGIALTGTGRGQSTPEPGR